MRSTSTPDHWTRHLLWLPACLAITTTGCLGLVANLIQASGGNMIPARYAGLKDRTVAVVCVSSSSLFGASPAADDLSSRIEYRLRQHLSGVQLIPQQKISEWIDRQGWDESDFRELGVGIGAQVVVGVDILSFSLHEGNTLYKGRCDVEINVFDMDQGGEVVYSEVLPQIQDPVVLPGRHITDISEANFRKQFLDTVAEKIAQTFYPHDRLQEFAPDAAYLGEN